MVAGTRKYLGWEKSRREDFCPGNQPLALPQGIYRCLLGKPSGRCWQSTAPPGLLTPCLMGLDSLKPCTSLWLVWYLSPWRKTTVSPARSCAWDCSYPGRTSSPWWWHLSPLSVHREEDEWKADARSRFNSFAFYLVNRITPRIYTESKRQEQDNPPSPFTFMSQFSVKIRWHRDNCPVSLFLCSGGRVCPPKPRINPLVPQGAE